MANGQLNRLLDFANMQMAAEAFLSQSVDDTPNRPPESELRTRLEDGNTHTSKFMPAQAEQFVAQYEVLTQYRNDSLLPGKTGFSGTLFRNRATANLRSPYALPNSSMMPRATTKLPISWSLRS